MTNLKILKLELSEIELSMNQHFVESIWKISQPLKKLETLHLDFSKN